MKILYYPVLFFGLAIGPVLAGGEVTIVLQKAIMTNGLARWEFAISNSSPFVIRCSQFSLASAIRAAMFTDKDGNSWQVIRSKQIIDPPPPEMDFLAPVLGRTSAEFSIQTEGLQKVPSSAVGMTDQPSSLAYKVERDVEVMDDVSKKSAPRKCFGHGNVIVEWRLVRK